MDSVRATLFENPLYVYIVLALGWAVLIGIWRARRTRRCAWSLAAPPILAGIVLVVSTLVVTDREQILAAARDIATNFERGDMAEIVRHLDEDFTATLEGQTIGKPAVEAVCSRARQRYSITEIRFHRPQVQVNGGSAAMSLITIIKFEFEGASGLTSLRWEIRWVKKGGSWKILRVQEPVREFSL